MPGADSLENSFQRHRSQMQRGRALAGNRFDQVSRSVFLVIQKVAQLDRRPSRNDIRLKHVKRIVVELHMQARKSPPGTANGIELLGFWQLALCIENRIDVALQSLFALLLISVKRKWTEFVGAPCIQNPLFRADKFEAGTTEVANKTGRFSLRCNHAKRCISRFFGAGQNSDF